MYSTVVRVPLAETMLRVRYCFTATWAIVSPITRYLGSGLPELAIIGGYRLIQLSTCLRAAEYFTHCGFPGCQWDTDG